MRTNKDYIVLKQLGDDIRSLRLHAGLTQDQLADKLGTSRDAVSHWEIGVNMPSPAMFPALVKVFRCSWGTLFHGVIKAVDGYVSGR